MSALGQKQTSDSRSLMSALPQKRTSFGTVAMSAKCQKRTLERHCGGLCDSGTGARYSVLVHTLKGEAAAICEQPRRPHPL
jgi:hypothetical protein